jgi:hypothetical protein
MAVLSNEYPQMKKASTGTIKLPPVFLGGASGDPREGLRNLEAMVKTMVDYFEGADELKLADLPARYAQYGGTVKNNDDIGLRRIHNWLHQVAFGVRAALLRREMERHGGDARRAVEATADVMLSEGTPLVFVAKNENEYRPLRYASRENCVRWLADEAKQMRTGANAAGYGAKVTDEEWVQNGVGMQFRSAHSDLKRGLGEMVEEAKKMDAHGRYAEADAIDEALSRMLHSIGSLG